jgi:hypothetical protein
MDPDPGPVVHNYCIEEPEIDFRAEVQLQAKGKVEPGKSKRDRI